MKLLLSLISITFLLSGCELLNMPEKMDAANAGVDKTNDKMKNLLSLANEQKMSLALDNMLRSENTRDLEPIPLGMLAGAELFGQAVTTDQMIKLAFVLSEQINDQTPTGKEDIYDHDKLIKYSELISISGLLPQVKVDEIISEQILNGGEYKAEAEMLLMARVSFLAVYLQEKMLGRSIDTIGKMEETINKLSSLDKILKLTLKYPSLKSKIKLEFTSFPIHAQITTFLYNDNGDFGDSSWNAPELWNKVLTKFKTNLKDGNLINANASEKSAAQSKIALMKAQVQGYIDSWK